MINRDVFYRAVQRSPFPGFIAISQRAGMDVILTEWERRGLSELSWLAYMLATAFHETARTMQPVIETRQPREASNPSVDEAIRRLENAHAAGRIPNVYWRKDADGKSWLGRGYVQLTHKFNYVNAQNKTGIRCADNPELMLQSGPACTVMFGGMIGGWFTGKKLADYPRKGDGSYDFFNMRRIINGLDQAGPIANYAKQFHAALIAASDNQVAAPPPPDVPPVTPQADTPAIPPVHRNSIIAIIGAWGAAVWAWVQTHPWEVGFGTLAVALAIFAIIKHATRKKES